MQEHVAIRFTGGVSLYPGALLSALTEDVYNDYNSADSRCGYSVVPESPEIAQEIKVWAPDIKRLHAACYRAVWELEQKLNRQIPVEIEIKGED